MLIKCLGIGFGVAIGLVAATSCIQPARNVDRFTNGSADSAHWVHEEQLYRVMTILHREASPNVDEQGVVDFERVDEFDRAKDTARWLSAAAARIPDAVADSDMSEENRQAFATLSRDLQFDSWDLYENAAARDVAGMHAAFDRISRRCNSCHSQFREWTGPLQNR